MRLKKAKIIAIKWLNNYNKIIMTEHRALTLCSNGILPVDGEVCPEFDHLFPDLGVLVGEGEETRREEVDQVVTVGHT